MFKVGEEFVASTRELYCRFCPFGNFNPVFVLRNNICDPAGENILMFGYLHGTVQDTRHACIRKRRLPEINKDIEARMDRSCGGNRPDDLSDSVLA